jgi:hypothetical protein
MDGLYETNFQFNGEFCKIRIRYSVIHNWSTIDHLIKWSILKFAGWTSMLACILVRVRGRICYSLVAHVSFLYYVFLSFHNYDMLMLSSCCTLSFFYYVFLSFHNNDMLSSFFAHVSFLSLCFCHFTTMNMLSFCCTCVIWNIIKNLGPVWPSLFFIFYFGLNEIEKYKIIFDIISS